MSLSLFVNNFWGGFMDPSKEAVNIIFFIELLERVFTKSIIITDDFQNADILLESVFGQETFVDKKQWKYTFFFSGESYLSNHANKFDCILCGKNTENKYVACPLFFAYLISSNLVNKIKNQDHNKEVKIPKNNKILVIITNPGDHNTIRNKYIEILQNFFPLDFAGKYKQNRPRIEAHYNTQEFYDEISNYRCIISMENSEDMEYITEKITHGLIAGIVPVYWGGKNIGNYFNTKRFIHLESFNEENIIKTLNEIQKVLNDDEYYLEKINQPIFADNSIEQIMDKIVKQIRTVMNIQSI